MGIFKRKNKRGRDFKEAKTTKDLKNMITKAAGLIKGGDRGGELEEAEYDLEEIKAASEGDSYIKVSLQKYNYLLFKAGYRFKSNNENALQYIKTRLYVMAYATGKPVDILFQEVGEDLVRYSNAFLVKSRTPQIMSGINATPAFDAKDPVGGYFRIDPSTVQVDRDKFGTIKSWTQNVDGEEKKYKASEVIHIYLDKDAANAFGTPRIVAALEDVKLLRSLEGNISTMIYRFAMPLYHFIIGLAQSGFQATNKEIEEAEETIDKLAQDGSVITNEKTQIKVIGAEGAAISAEGYLKYFEQRVFTALSTSDAGMGRGGAKQDADSMEAQSHDIVKHYQKTISIFFQHFIINELLMEGGFDPILNEDDRVEMVFNEINVETKIKLENHEVYKFQSNVNTIEETRRNIGMVDEADEKRLYDQMVKVEAEREIAKIRGDESIRIAEESHKMALEMQKNTLDAQAKIATDKNNAAGNKGVNPKGNGNSGDKKPDKGAENTQNPRNQHGTTSVKVKESFNIQEKSRKKKAHKKKFEDIYKKYSNLRNDINVGVDDRTALMNMVNESITRDVMNEVNIKVLDGILKATDELRKNKKMFYALPAVNIPTSEYEEGIRDDISKIFNDINSRIEKGEPVEQSFDRLEYRMRFVIEYVLAKVYWHGYVLAAKSLGLKEAYIHFDNSKDAEKHNEVIDLRNLNTDSIPPFHPYCDCKISLKKKEAE